MRVTEIVWKERFAVKLREKHRVSTDEVEDLLSARPLIRRMHRGRVRGEDVYAAMGQIGSGRYLTVIFINKGGGVVLPISARDMDRSERRYHGKRR